MIFGASVRAAAQSAIRAGLRPWCADLFADRDLQEIACARRIAMSDYPHGFEKLIDQAPNGPWFYTGGLENHPKLLSSIAKQRRLLGVSGNTLRLVRSPTVWSKTLRDAHIPCPQMSVKTPQPGRTIWLQKPKRGAAGHGISFWNGGRIKRGCFLQEYIPGESHSAVFLGRGHNADLLGVTKQLVANVCRTGLEPRSKSRTGLETRSRAASPFAYCGSIGPIALPPNVNLQIQRIGERLANALGLRGLFGVDFILAGETAYPVEINPRYTASVEILEYAFGQSMLSLHCGAFDSHAQFQSNHGTDGAVGKTIIYAQAPLTIPSGLSNRMLSWKPDDPFTMAESADIPNAGETIEQGKPIMTVFARGASVADCRRALREKTESIDRDLTQLYKTK